ncbi:hypothetical protein ABZ876_04195 [Streptomyces sp. NPDC046931]|uniref:hypothetical protein n=1 Tax=Streptomyces sp. NPDC046931 TaxID=3154806 RepID=UPI0033EB9B43
MSRVRLVAHVGLSDGGRQGLDGEVLDLRMERAAVLFLGADYRRAALPEVDALVGAFSRTAGPTSEKARSCRAQAAPNCAR